MDSSHTQHSGANVPWTPPSPDELAASLPAYELVAAGGSGFLLRNEIYTPAISLLRLAGQQTCKDQFQLLAFHDFGFAELADPLVGENKRIDLQSAGVGFRWQIEENASIRFDYGWQIEDIGLADSSRAHVGVTVTY